MPVNKHACSTCSTNFHNYSGIFNWWCTNCGVGGSVVRKFSLKWVLHITREITIYQCERANNWGTFWRHRPETCLSFGHWFNPNPLLRYISVHSFLWMIIKYHKVDYNLPVWTCPYLGWILVTQPETCLSFWSLVELLDSTQTPPSLGTCIYRFNHFCEWVLHITWYILIYQCGRVHNWGAFWWPQPETCLSFGHWSNPAPSPCYEYWFNHFCEWSFVIGDIVSFYLFAYFV